MKVYEGIEEFKKIKNAVVTSGTFDGVHIGHQKILNTLQNIAEQIGGESVLITYWPHPRLVLDPANDTIKLLTCFEERVRVLERLGLDHLIKIPFNKEFAKLSSQEFIDKVLIDGIGTHTLVIGYDHRFGRNREGSFEALKENAPDYGFEVREIPRQDVKNVGVSSSKIRKSLSEGDIHISNQFLGWEYCLNGKVVEGDQLGRKIGFPTANIKINSDLKLIPAGGSYAVRVIHKDTKYQGMLNIGTRPTVDGSNLTIEVNIFDFDQEIYDNDISIRMVRLIRKENKFESLELLKEQLILDRELARKMLNS
ncbi:MAG: bifunctional riboflavin kinase/FAD synthetase [Bacteroidota bacterium]